LQYKRTEVSGTSAREPPTRRRSQPNEFDALEAEIQASMEDRSIETAARKDTGTKLKTDRSSRLAPNKRAVMSADAKE